MSKTRKITIVVALTDDLIEKSQHLFKSLEKNAPNLRKCILIIDKTQSGGKVPLLGGTEPNPKDGSGGFETATIPLSKLTSYRPDWPKNRKFYACAEGGEFLDHFHFESDEVIIKLDADFIMQRPMTDDEWMSFQTMPHGIVRSNWTSWPPTTLREEFWKLMPEFGYDKARRMYPGDWSGNNMFCAGFIACTAGTYRKLSKSYLYHHRKITQLFGHHAAGQWLMNWIVGTHFTFQPQPDSLHNGIWYIDTPCYDRGLQLYYKDTPVLFNHTKYLKDYNY